MNNVNATGRRVLVVGLGISGTATALRLRQIGWDPVVVEKAPARRTGGQYIVMFGAGQAAARRLGILDRMTDRNVADGSAFSVDRAGNRRRVPNFAERTDQFAAQSAPYMLMRSDVEEAAFSALPGDVDIRFSTVPSSIVQDADGVDVTLTHTVDGSTTTERFDLVVGADGLRSTVRSLAFGPHSAYVRRLGVMYALIPMSEPPAGYTWTDSVMLQEPGRTMQVVPVAGRTPVALMAYRTADVDAEFREPPAQRLREVFSSGPTDRELSHVLSELDNMTDANDVLFDSAEQVHMNRWHAGRVVLVGDAAWCTTLIAGMGVSTGLAGSELLGTMLHRYPDDLDRALNTWEARLRPFLDYYGTLARRQQGAIAPANQWQVKVNRGLLVAIGHPLVGPLLKRLASAGKEARMRSADIAAA
jgi:2-polyprenyl-6-methoxyphenol hydroxylase-like FAD-dependent oxidoreductase